MNIDVIMSVLEEKGLDKRFRKNPEAVNRIGSLLANEIENSSGKQIIEMGRGEIEESTKDLLNRSSYVDTNGIRNNNEIRINEDGSLSVKYKTNDLGDKNTGIHIENTEESFNIAENTGNLIIGEVCENFMRGYGEKDTAIGITSIRIDTFNPHGLEVQGRIMDQAIYEKEAKPFGRPNSMKELLNTETRRSELHEMLVSRNPDLVTAYCINERTECTNYGLASSTKGIIKQAIATDRSWRHILGDELGIGVYSKKTTLEGNALCDIDYNNPNRMYIEPSKEAIDQYKNMSDYNKTALKQQIYKSASNNQAFANTLIENARTNPELKKVIETLGLTNPVGEQKLKGIYEETQPEKISETMQTIRETTQPTISNEQGRV